MGEGNEPKVACFLDNDIKHAATQLPFLAHGKLSNPLHIIIYTHRHRNAHKIRLRKRIQLHNEKPSLKPTRRITRARRRLFHPAYCLP